MPKAVYSIFLLALLRASVNAAEPSSLEGMFQRLNPGSLWQPVETRAVAFPTHHPQGMTAVGERFFLSSVEVIDRATEQGKGHLFEMDRQGALLRSIQLGEGALYHPGGIDYDGARIWVPVAAYRPDSAAIVYTVNPATMESREMFRFDDHLGALSHFPEQGLLIGVNWGSRRFYRWKTEQREGEWIVPDAAHPETQRNGNYYIDYQDMQRIPGTAYLLCGGLQTYVEPGKKGPSFALGGIDLVHTEGLRAHHQLPMPLRSQGRRAWTQNPFFVETCEQGLRFFFIPEDNTSLMYIFELSVKE